MTGRRRIRVINRGDTVVIRGWRAGDLARDAGVKAVFNGVAHGWVIDNADLPDLVALLEHRGIPVVIEVGEPG